MDNHTTLNELKQHVKKFCDDRDWDSYHTPKELAIGIITEAAELLQLFRFKTDQQIKELLEHPEKKDRIHEELADTLYMVLRLSQLYNIDLTTALKRKIEKNEKNYPIETSKGQLYKKYNEL